MPVPRRPITLLVQDAVGTLPTYRKQRPAMVVERRCGRCDCLLAADQRESWCSPCQSKTNGTPWLVGEYLSSKPYRPH